MVCGASELKANFLLKTVQVETKHLKDHFEGLVEITYFPTMSMEKLLVYKSLIHIARYNLGDMVIRNFVCESICQHIFSQKLIRLVKGM
jgi:hypothetical protein